MTPHSTRRPPHPSINSAPPPLLPSHHLLPYLSSTSSTSSPTDYATASPNLAAIAGAAADQSIDPRRPELRHCTRRLFTLANDASTPSLDRRRPSAPSDPLPRRRSTPFSPVDDDDARPSIVHLIQRLSVTGEYDQEKMVIFDIKLMVGFGCDTIPILKVPPQYPIWELPKKIADYLDGKEPAKVYLRAADCGPRLWTVEVLFDGQGRMYLDKGWEKFAIAHGVDFGWFVHFKYEGDDVLTVKVFDGTMCRRYYYSDDEDTDDESDDDVKPCIHPL
ncbi:hypothetical protein QYE76_069948 [Lolium multiflorum]|uniref:TF-B3 domain-containing protein n=1 Tax=Lolium multiflorum TaxID=4521 RepID=A0AAD8WDH1_LOLMU|nr:hypothetical protein QYE76_069948 [Lolium multiflorum]